MGELKPVATFRAGQIVPPWLIRCVWAKSIRRRDSNTLYARPRPQPVRKYKGRRGQHLITFSGDSEVYRIASGWLVVPLPGVTPDYAIRLRCHDGVFVGNPPVLWHGKRDEALREHFPSHRERDDGRC